MASAKRHQAVWLLADGCKADVQHLQGHRNSLGLRSSVATTHLRLLRPFLPVIYTAFAILLLKEHGLFGL